MDELVQAALNTANGEIGVREEPENRGKRVELYQASVGAPPGSPWCAAFVFWCAETAAGQLHQRNPLLRSAYCPDIAHWADDREILFSDPEAGDIFLRFGVVEGIYRASHTGFVSRVEDERFNSVEGNTNIDGSREGIGVFARTRLRASNFKYVRWSALVPSEPGEVYELDLDGNTLCDAPVVDGRALCPVRTLGERLGIRVGWDNDAQAPTLDGRELTSSTTLIGGRAYVPIRDMAREAGFDISVDVGKHRIAIARKAVN